MSECEKGDRVVSHYYGPGEVIRTGNDMFVARWDAGGESYISPDDPAVQRVEE